MRPLFALVVLCWTFAAAAQEPTPPPAMLAEVYHEGDAIELRAWRVSEKFDGVRAWWDGRHLLTRSGHVIAAPAWFTAGWPDTVLDGELWIGRGQFELVSGSVRRQQPIESEWKRMRYLVFDLPEQAGDFDARNSKLASVVVALRQPWVQAVEQRRVDSIEALRRYFDAVIVEGGEGLMLKRGASAYQAGRSADLRKYKPYDDAEAVVIGHVPGKGKYENKLGSLIVRDAQGREFRVGSGLRDLDREQPPAIGRTITYAYTGLTRDGLPRFARFLRVRPDSP
ncbi:MULTISPECIES: DNA ligase [Hydrocarboniphaga]|jgi:DNA ligase-1|uniref:ATP-dependent DNA ligase family profile domain-containing protein n=1 Tax=Hydrocarboniphaga effusa AP103 TaxID=1172194 RepID=I8T8V7_9GAMM|nr:MULTISPECIES: DNA ligase [Hydrocarboniphaga]EIT70400.1 hypothetical protein WQQ_05370 [Hydrocarboniphaga effusa AP103]MDZ4078341.1 DNA ligase [Hydrocarboniphaga sp.]